MSDDTIILRSKRQAAINRWAIKCFGVAEALSLPQRGLRLAEEAIELAQAVGTDPTKLHVLIDYVYARPPGTIEQELGGVGVTVLALAAAAGVSANDCEIAETRRVLAKDPVHFAQRNTEKNLAGFKE